MVALMPSEGPRVFDVIGQPTSRGVTWAWTREDLDRASAGRACAELEALFTEHVGPRRLLIYVGVDRFVGLAGLRVLLDVGGQARRRGGTLAVVAPPHCFNRMLSCLGLEEQLVVFDSVQDAASQGWTRPPLALRTAEPGHGRRSSCVRTAGG